VTQFESQIIAASELLRTISSTPSAKDAAVDVYLESLSRALSGAILSPANIGCEIFSDQGRLPVDVCERLGFILVELVFNASKYAFADRNNGVVRIEMTRSGGYWCCTVSDNGIGMDGGGRGTGLNIVDALVRSLKGRLIMRSGASGTCVCMILPDHTIPRSHGSVQDAVAVGHAAVDPAQWSRSINRMDNTAFFELSESARDSQIREGQDLRPCSANQKARIQGIVGRKNPITSSMESMNKSERTRQRICA
jgi:hypothetical protein